MRLYLRISWAAIQRFKLERPIRRMWADVQPTMKRKKIRTAKRLPFPTIVSTLVNKGYIDPSHQSVLTKEYNRLSDVLHGGLTAGDY